MGLASDHHDKVNIKIKQVTQTFWFPIAYKKYALKKVMPALNCGPLHVQ